MIDGRDWITRSRQATTKEKDLHERDTDMQIMKSDAQIQKDVLDELAWDTRVEETDVGVEVANGIVTLSGTVSSYAKKLAASEAAHRVPGVLDVANDIRVHVPNPLLRTDSDIAQAVRDALIWDAFVPEEQIQSTVSDGWVTLEGEVGRWAQRTDVEQVVSRLLGVKGVTNHIAVKAPPIGASAIRETIERALERRAEREARRVEVRVEDGTVTLSGRVQTWPERHAIVQAISHTPGVRAVADQIHVDPSL
jgi:osmotically-inducible protein OsmY